MEERKIKVFKYSFNYIEIGIIVILLGVLTYVIIAIVNKGIDLLSFLGLAFTIVTFFFTLNMTKIEKKVDKSFTLLFDLIILSKSGDDKFLQSGEFNVTANKQEAIGSMI